MEGASPWRASDGRRQPSSERTPDVEGPFDTSGRYLSRISDARDVITVLSGHTQSEGMVNAADYLIGKHQLLDEIDIPWVPSRDKAIITDSPEWDKADPVYKPLADGHYLDTKLSKGGKKREIQRMAKICGLGVTFDGDW